MLFSLHTVCQVSLVSKLRHDNVHMFFFAMHMLTRL